MRWAQPAGAPRRSTSGRATTCSAPSSRPGASSRRPHRSTARDGAAAASARASAASETELFELVDEIARQLLASQKIAPGTRLARIAALTTGSLDALRAYLQGERELRGGRYFDAMERFQAAVDADPSFALAYYRLAAAAAGCALPDLAREFADRSHQHRARLSPHDHLVLSAQRAWLDGAVGEAESLYNTITGTYPDDVEAWFHLGDLLFHLNPLRGRSAAEARKPFERVVALEPDHVGAMVHLVRIAAIEGRRDEMLDLIARILRASPDGDQALAMRALRAHAARDAAGMETVARELQSARAITVAIAFADVALYSGNLDGADALARRFIQVARSPELRALCHIQLAHLALARGKRDSAREELAHAERLDRTWGLEMRGLLATLPFAPAAEAELRRLRDELAAWDAAAAAAEHLPDLRDAQRPAPDDPGLSAGPPRRQAGRRCRPPAPIRPSWRGWRRATAVSPTASRPSWTRPSRGRPARRARRWRCWSAPARGSGSSSPWPRPSSPSPRAASSRPSCCAKPAARRSGRLVRLHRAALALRAGVRGGGAGAIGGDAGVRSAQVSLAAIVAPATDPAGRGPPGRAPAARTASRGRGPPR